jgi:ABC-type glycerol-3-phosphate transport system permease component
MSLKNRARSSPSSGRCACRRGELRLLEGMRSYIFNSLLFGALSVVGVVFLSSLAGSVFARHRFPGKEMIYLAILALLMIPGVLTLIPSFVLVRQLGLLDTPWALILPWTAGGQVFGIMLCRSYFATIPNELFEAGRIDGASELSLYSHIALPLSWPILITLDHTDRHLQRLHLAVVGHRPMKQVVGVNCASSSTSSG